MHFACEDIVGVSCGKSSENCSPTNARRRNTIIMHESIKNHLQFLDLKKNCRSILFVWPAAKERTSWKRICCDTFNIKLHIQPHAQRTRLRGCGSCCWWIYYNIFISFICAANFHLFYLSISLSSFRFIFVSQWNAFRSLSHPVTANAESDDTVTTDNVYGESIFMNLCINREFGFNLLARKLKNRHQLHKFNIQPNPSQWRWRRTTAATI